MGAAVPWGSATPAPAPCLGQSPSGRLQQGSGQPHGTGMLLHVPVTRMVLHVPLTGLLLHVPSAEVLLHVPISGLLPHVPIVRMLPRSTGAGWPHPSGCSPQLTPGDTGTSVALGGAEAMLRGLWPVPRGPQQLLSLTAHQDPPAALPISMARVVLLCFAGPPCPAQQIQSLCYGQLFPAPRPLKIRFAFPRNQTAIFKAGEKAVAEKGGEQGQAEQR